MNVLTVVGARPQFIKAAAVCRALRAKGHTEFLVHTGQHYDHQTSQVFFDELGIPPPDVNLEVGSGAHGWQTGMMLMRLEELILAEKPDWVIVYGDTNSTLAGALAGSKLNVRIAHVEAGLRSYNRAMPEEINRIVADHLSDLLLCPSQTAVDNLRAEGITEGVRLVGDVMFDALAYVGARAQRGETILKPLGLEPHRYLLATVHRAENTDDMQRLQKILFAFASLQEPVLFPVHPRTRKLLNQLAPEVLPANVRLIDPVGYLDMVQLTRTARMILTDSGGLQKEAYWLGVPCITLRSETEWVETVAAGWNVLTGVDPATIVKALTTYCKPASHPPLYGDGHATTRIVEALSYGN